MKKPSIDAPETLSEFNKYRQPDGEPRFTDIQNITWSGRTVWEKQHPTFVSHSRKTFIIAPRKTGHSTLRFALAEANENYGDDWFWLDGGNTHPKHWLDEDDFWDFVYETHYEVVKEKKFQMNRMLMPDEYYDEHISEPQWDERKEKIFKLGDSSVDKFFGTAIKHWKETYPLQPQTVLWAPYIMSEYFKDWKVYLIVREPWDRFVSGLITELDNGIYTPWFTDYQHQDKELWEESYIRMKRLLMWNDAENLLYGTPNGPQTDHTFILSSWKWDSKSMFDRADHFIPCVPQIDWTFKENNWDWSVEGNGSTMIQSLKNAELIPEEIDDGRMANPNDWQWTNVSPPNRNHIIHEASTNDEDLKPFFDRCREIVQEDSDIIKNHEVKFL